MTGALVVQANGLRLPLPDESVDLIVTSPPYAFLRSYDTGYPDLEVGNEATPAAYLEALWAATAEMMRVLKPSGSIFVDLGDKYGRGTRTTNTTGKRMGGTSTVRARAEEPATGHEKSLMLLPERYRVGCVDRLGLIARAVICWNKPNGLPESVQDRVRRSHEDWVHLVKQPRYYSAVDEIRLAHAAKSVYQQKVARENPNGHADIRAVVPGQSPQGGMSKGLRDLNPLGALPGSVWEIPSEPLRLPGWLGVDHYAAFPSEWPRRLVLGWSPPGICVDCGQGRVPVVDRERLEPNDRLSLATRARTTTASGTHVGSTLGYGADEAQRTILGYACSCTPYTDHPGSGESSGPHGIAGNDPRAGDGYEGTGAGQGWGGKGHLANRPKVGLWREYHLDRWQPPPTRPAVVLDPFMGTGTTLGVARQLGRIGVGVDLSYSYCRAARYRIFDSDDFGKAVSRTWSERQGSLL